MPTVYLSLDSGAADGDLCNKAVWSAELVALFSLFGQMPWTSAFTALVQNFAAVLKGSSVVGSVNFPLLQVFEKLKIFSLMVLGIIFLFFYSKYRLRSAERKKR